MNISRGTKPDAPTLYSLMIVSTIKPCEIGDTVLP